MNRELFIIFLYKSTMLRKGISVIIISRPLFFQPSYLYGFGFYTNTFQLATAYNLSLSKHREVALELPVFHPNIASIFIAVPWASAPAAQIAADLVTIFNTIANNSRGQLGDMKRVRVLLPPVQAQLAMNLIVSAAGEKSVMKYFTDNNGIRPDQIEVVHQFGAANSQIYAGGPYGLARDRGAVIYNAPDRWNPRFVLPLDIEMPAPPRQNGLSETTFYHMRVGGMLVADAGRMLYIKGL